MPDACLFNILDVPPEALQRLLPRVSVKSIARLASAYPRSIGRIFMALLSQTMSPATLNFLREEMVAIPLPSYIEIHEAESELMRLLAEENLLPAKNTN